MSALLLAALKVAYLVLMWLFILFVANVIRIDLFGRRATPDELAAGGSTGGIAHQARQTRPPAPVASPPTPTRIVITSGRAQGASAALPAVGDEITLGRAADCQLDVDDDYASSRHARLWHDREGFVVEDLLSTNGTYVNGQQISQPTRIGIGDIVRVGRSQLQLEV